MTVEGQVQPNELSTREEQQMQTELELVLTGRTRFVTPRLVLSTEEAADTSFAKAFDVLCKQMRSPAWKESLLLFLGHDLEKWRGELECKTRLDEAKCEAIDSKLRAFFDNVLAPMMQERESSLVNTIHECVHQEIEAHHVALRNQQQRTTQLVKQTVEWEKQVVHLKSKVDRRVAENNALRKEQYRQLLMLREMMSKQGTEPSALFALNEAIATVLAGKQPTLAPQSNNDQDPSKTFNRTRMSVSTDVQALCQEKDKWKLRAREATVECEELRDKVVSLIQENTTYRAVEMSPWFLKPENAVAERQRIADAVRSYQGKWEDIGDSLVELLNNDILWAAMEQSARRGKQRISKGFEAMLARLDSSTQSPSIDNETASDNDKDYAVHRLDNKRLTSFEFDRLAPCKTCNGAKYIRANEGGDSVNDSGAYLRKTLEQLLELKTQLENANNKSVALEGQLRLSRIHTVQLQEKVRLAEFKPSTVDSCLQTDLDDDKGLDLDEIMRSAYGQGTTGTDAPRLDHYRNRRNVQYDNLIVELKSTLADKDEGLAESRKALELAQARAVTLQRALQQEKVAHSQELAMIKTSLTFALRTRNSKIEDRQATVKLLLRKFVKKVPQAIPSRGLPLAPMDESRHEEDDEGDEEDTTCSGGTDEAKANEQKSEQHKIHRMQLLAQRYADDIIRVRKEYELQQELLKKVELDMTVENEKRSRTNSICQGNVVVNAASHPRDLFKALSIAQGDLLKLRRASQHSSTLQTDRLLTLTTHLGHMSEELCSLRKRHEAELEFWELECKKRQNANKMLEAELQVCRTQLREVQDGSSDMSSRGCALCERRKKRLMQISNELLHGAQALDAQGSTPSALTTSERSSISNALLDLETAYSRMTAANQQLARELVATHLGKVHSPRSLRRSTVTLKKFDSSSIRMDKWRSNDDLPVGTRSSSSSPRKSIGAVKCMTFNRLSKHGDAGDNKENTDKSPAQANLDDAAVSCTGQSSDHPDDDQCSSAQENVPGSSNQNATDHEVLERVLSDHGLVTDNQTLDGAGIEEQNFDSKLEDTDDNTSINNAAIHSLHTDNDVQDGPVFDGENKSNLDVKELTSMNYRSDIERDPGAIHRLQCLINQSAAASERFIATKWQVLVGRLMWMAGEQRLEQLKLLADRRAETCPDQSLCLASHKISSLYAAMTMIVRSRKKAVGNAMSAQEDLRQNVKKTQAQLIHGVAMLLGSLNRKRKPAIQLNELLYSTQSGSPRKSPTSHRPLYPSTTVRLNELPTTQQISTPTFPTVLEPRARRPRTHGERIGSSDSENDNFPHRLTRSAGSRLFRLVHSSIGTLQGSVPFPNLGQIPNRHDLEGRGSTHSGWDYQRPVRPHSSPASQRFMSPRAHDFIALTSSLHVDRPKQIAEAEADNEANYPR